MKNDKNSINFLDAEKGSDKRFLIPYRSWQEKTVSVFTDTSYAFVLVF